MIQLITTYEPGPGFAFFTTVFLILCFVVHVKWTQDKRIWEDIESKAAKRDYDFQIEHAEQIKKDRADLEREFPIRPEGEVKILRAQNKPEEQYFNIIKTSDIKKGFIYQGDLVSAIRTIHEPTQIANTFYLVHPVMPEQLPSALVNCALEELRKKVSKMWGRMVTLSESDLYNVKGGKAKKNKKKLRIFS